MKKIKRKSLLDSWVTTPQVLDLLKQLVAIQPKKTNKSKYLRALILREAKAARLIE